MATAVQPVAAAEGLVRLLDLTTEIKFHEKQAQASAVTALEHKVEIGKRLIEARELLPHGEFLTWTRLQFNWSTRHVYRHIELASNLSRVTSLAGLSLLNLA